MKTTETTYATQDFLQDALAKAKMRITQLEESQTSLALHSYTNSADKNCIVEGMQEWTLNELENNGITESQAEEIAEICGFELTKEFELEVTVLYSVTVNARTEEEAQNAIHDTDFDSVSYNDPITYLSSSVDRIDI